jgi:single-strand selective monofunctional uracil DNA glycosylase
MGSRPAGRGLGGVTDLLLRDLGPLRFGPPVTHVYNPLLYAREPYDRYLARYGNGPKQTLLVGMNPGPWGMVQTGVPFGDVGEVRDWLGIEGPVGRPARPHPRRPVEGFACRRREGSGRRVWGWARRRFGSPERFFERFFVANYCPLAFFEASGANRTPDKLPAASREPLFAACDRALARTVEALGPSHVFGFGRFAAERAAAALAALDVPVGRIPHPSPASPAANRGWDALIDAVLAEHGIAVGPGAER